MHRDDVAHALDLIGVVEHPRVAHPVEQHVECELLAHPLVLVLAGAGDLGEVLGQLHRADAPDVPAGRPGARVAPFHDDDVAHTRGEELAGDREAADARPDDDDVGPGRRRRRAEERRDRAAGHRCSAAAVSAAGWPASAVVIGVSSAMRSRRRTGRRGGRPVGRWMSSGAASPSPPPIAQLTADRQYLPWHGPVRAPVRRFTSSGSVYPATSSARTSQPRTSSQKHSTASVDAALGGRPTVALRAGSPATNRPRTLVSPSGPTSGPRRPSRQPTVPPAARTRSRFGVRSPKITTSTRSRRRDARPLAPSPASPPPASTQWAHATRPRPPMERRASVRIGPTTPAPTSRSAAAAAMTSSPPPTSSARSPGRTP